MSDDPDKPWRLPNAKRMTFDDMAARAQYEWQRAEDAEAEVKHQADRIEELKIENTLLRQRWWDAGDVTVLVGTIADLETKLKTAEEIGRAFEENAGQLRKKLAKLTKAAERVHDSYWNSTDGIVVGMFDLGEALRHAKETPHD